MSQPQHPGPDIHVFGDQIRAVGRDDRTGGLPRFCQRIGTGGRLPRPPILNHRKRVLLCLAALRTNLTERALAVIFGTSQSTAHRIIRDLLPAVAARSTAATFDPVKPCCWMAP